MCNLNLCGSMCRCGSLCGRQIVHKGDVCKEYCKSVLGRGDGGLGFDGICVGWF